MDRRSITLNHNPFFLRTWRDPKRPPLLILHGFPEYGGAWALLALRLADHFYCVAYGITTYYTGKVNRLIIGNGVHPIPFKRELAAGSAQAEASQYIETLRKDGSEDRLTANDFPKLKSLFSAQMSFDWMTPDIEVAYKTEWARPRSAPRHDQLVPRLTPQNPSARRVHHRPPQLSIRQAGGAMPPPPPLGYAGSHAHLQVNRWPRRFRRQSHPHDL